MVAVRERVKVVGVDCPACVLSIQKSLAKIGARAEIDAATGDAVVVYDAERATLADVVRAIRDAGYDVEKEVLLLSVEVDAEEAGVFEEKVTGLRGVIGCRFSPVTGLARVTYNPYSVSSAELVDAVRRLGYKVEKASGVSPQAGERRPAWVPLLSFLLGLSAVTLHSLASLRVIPMGVVDATLPFLATLVVALNLGILARGFKSLFRGAPTMESLVSLSSTMTYAFSLLVFLGVIRAHSSFFEASAGVLGFVSAGKYLEDRLRARAQSHLAELAEMQRGRARVLRDGGVVEVDAWEVRVGEVVEVRAGERIPVDGVVVEGWGYVDESSFTGEPEPRFKSAERRDSVLAGSMLLQGYVRVRATRVGGETSLAYIVEEVREAQFRKPSVQRLADRVVGLLTWAVVALSAGTFLYWYLRGLSPVDAALFAASVLAVTCPCPLGIAVPMVAALATIKAVRLGVLVRGADVFERMLAVDTVVFDKTGTLTRGAPRVKALYTFNGFSEDAVLRLLCAAESRSEHPLARAVLDYCSEKGVAGADPEKYEHFPGMGVLAALEGAEVVVGSPKLMEAFEVPVDGEAKATLEREAGEGNTVFLVAVNKRLAAAVVVGDTVREEAGRVVAYFKERGVRVVLATGDSAPAGKAVASMLGIDEVYAELRPEDKVELVEKMREEGRRTLFVGDGVNDAAAIGRAHLGVAMGGGAEVSRSAGDAVLVSGELSSLVDLHLLSAAVRKKMLENLAWAFAYNVLLVPVAAGALYEPFGVTLRPEMAAVAMMLSDISVVANALTMLRWKAPTRAT